MGKTALTALVSRALMRRGVRPLLLIDADPAGGLGLAIGNVPEKTLAGVREELIAAARGADESQKERIADRVDYLTLQALVEGDGYSFLAMGRSNEKGCYCPVNAILRESVAFLAEPFALVLIDAEAGLEQINRQVMRGVDRVVAVTDGSARGENTLNQIVQMAGSDRVSVVYNRTDAPGKSAAPFLGAIPDDEALSRFDREGRSLWELDRDNAAAAAVERIVERLIGIVGNDTSAHGWKDAASGD